MRQNAKAMNIERDPDIRFHERGTLTSVTKWFRIE